MSAKRDWKYWITPQFRGDEGYESPKYVTVDEAHDRLGGWLDRYFEFLKRMGVVAALGYAAKASQSVWMDRFYLVSFALLVVWFALPVSRVSTKIDDAIKPTNHWHFAWRLGSVFLWIVMSACLFSAMQFALTAIAKPAA